MELHGEWGESQGNKAPCLNRGDSHALQVLSWRPDVIKVKIPPDLPPGRYKLGVYCGMGENGGRFSTDWVDFDIKKAEGADARGPGAADKPLPESEPGPEPAEYTDSAPAEPDQPAAGPEDAEVKHCGIALHRPDKLAASPGDILELGGYWGGTKGNKTPFLMNKALNILTVVSWSSETIKVRIPQWLPLGRYKLGVYCDKPGRGLGLGTLWFDFDLLEKGNAALEPEPAGRSRRQEGSPPSLRYWLKAHRKLGEALIWEGMDGPENYFSWPEDRKAALDRYFLLAWNGEPFGLPDPPPNRLKLRDDHTAGQNLSEEDALNLYLATAAQSLALEAGRHLPWLLEDTSPENIAAVLSGKEMFTRLPGGDYRVDGGKNGFIVPPPPDAGYAFMQDKIGRDRFDTIVAVLEWIGREVIHFEGDLSAKNMEAQWGYRGYPPATRLIKGTYYAPKRGGADFSHRTAGCTGTAGFLRAVLRCVNIPAEAIHPCSMHTLVSFPTEKRYLSHGDDPYTGMRGWNGPCEAAKLLIDETTFNSWFGKDVPREECAGNIGRGPKEMVSRPCPRE